MEEAFNSSVAVETFSAKTGDFFEVEQNGGQILLSINEDHPFYTQIYARPDFGPEVKETVHLLLLSIGKHMVRARAKHSNAAAVYEAEKRLWSSTLSLVLSELRERVPTNDKREYTSLSNSDEGYRPQA